MKYFTFLKIQIIFLIISHIYCLDNEDEVETIEKVIEISDTVKQEQIDEKEKTKGKKPPKQQSYISFDDPSIKSIEVESIDFKEPIELSDIEMDTLILCTYLSHQALKKKYTNDIKKIADKLGVKETKKVYDKLGAEFLENCVNNIENEVVNKYITNLTYHNNFQWEKEFDEYTKIDPDKFNDTSDLKFSIDQQILLKFLKQSNEEFERRKRQRKGQKEPEKPKTVQTNKNNEKKIKKNVKSNDKGNINSFLTENILKEIIFFTWFFIIILAFGGIIYCWKKIYSNKNEENKEDKMKKKKKKTN